MKRLLTLLSILSNVTLVSAGELDAIDLISPTSYVRPSTISQTAKSKLQVGIGDAFNIDVVAKVKVKIAPYKADLASYFPKAGELDSFIDRIVVDGKNSIIGNDLTDAKLIKYYEHLGNNLIGGFSNKILEVEGVIDPARRTIWVNKITRPFKSCIATAKNALYDANHCLDALTSSLVPSTGIGLVYELSRQSLSSSLPENQKEKFNVEQAQYYKSCMRATVNAAADVKNCALQSMKSGVLKITEPKLGKTIEKAASSMTAARAIKQEVWPVFNQCTQKVGLVSNDKTPLTDQFMNCIDTLFQNTGVQLVQDKVLHNATVKSNFSKIETGKLAIEKGESFKNCLADQKNKNIRVDGLLNTARCENLVTNEVTYKVVLKTLVDTARDSFKTDEKAKAGASAESEKFLNACWNDEQSGPEREGCLRKTILSVSQFIAKMKLDKSIGDDIKNKEELVSSALKDFSNCLEKNLPANISEANNLSAKTSLCSNKLTVDMALKVAQESVRSKSAEQKMNEDEINQLIKTYVDTKFKACIGSAPGDADLNRCSGELKKNAAISLASFQIKNNAQGKMTPAETDKLLSVLVDQKFTTCLGDSPSDKVLNSCVANLTKAATKSIVLAYQQKQIKAQLNADVTPADLKPVEDAFSACTEKDYPSEEVSSAMDDCTKNYALDFARALGDLKLNSLLKSMLGTQGFNEHKKNIDNMLGKYHDCLNDLRNTSMNDNLLGKITVCTDGLQERGINFISSTVNTWMTAEEKDAATIMIKNDFARLLPCMSGLLPTSPFSEKMEQETKSILKPVALILAQYIEYSPETAKRTLDEITLKLATDLKDVASNPASRKELIEMLYNNGALDQFLKSMVRAQIKTAFDTIPETELTNSLKNILLSKDNFDKIFATEEGKAIKNIVMENILKPVLMDQASLSSPLMVAGMDAVKDKVVKMLVFSPHFGDQIIKTSIQNQINNMGGMTRFFAKAIYGKSSLDWEKVRTTEKGKGAEDFIKENILMPKFKGQVRSASEDKKINEEAEKRVKAAVKSYE